MATGRFECSKCSRTFSMAAHLGRHMSTLHATKRRKKVRRVKATSGTAPRVVAGGAAAMLRRLRAHRRRLLAKRLQIEAQISTITSVVESLENLS